MEYIGNSIIQRITQKGTDSRVVFYTNIGDSVKEQQDIQRTFTLSVLIESKYVMIKSNYDLKRNVY